MSGFFVPPGLFGGLIGYYPAGDPALLGMQAQMAASNEQAMRASMQSQTLPRDDTEYLRGLMNAAPRYESPYADPFAHAWFECKRLREELARPDWVFIWWLGFLGLGALLRWRFW